MDQEYKVRLQSDNVQVQSSVVNIASVSESASVEAAAPGDSVAERLVRAESVVREAAQQAKHGNFSVAFESHVLQELAYLMKHYPAAFQRARASLRLANSLITYTELDKAIKNFGLTASVAKQTHHGYAKEILVQLTIDGHSPVSHQGLLHVVDRSSALWKKHTMDSLASLVAETHDGKDNCKRNGDYTGISKHAVALVESSDFFGSADVGLACADGFYRIVGDTFKVEPLTPSHRQRVKVNFTPKEIETPIFDKFLRETFASKDPDEELQQVALVQEMAGAIMLGLAPRYHKAFLFYDPIGRAGKGTLEKILRQLVPKEFTTAITPFRWHDEYYVASLQGSRLNVVGELDDGRSIPAAHFKSVIGCDLITGRHPMGRTMDFTNEAAHLFTSNHFVSISEQSEAIYSRWLIVGFPNSLLKSGRPLDTTLHVRIIESELSGIAFWALKGAARLLSNGKFSSSKVHDRHMTKWRLGNSSLNEFIDECCDLVPKDQFIRRADLNKAYRDWCGENGRKEYPKAKVKDLLEHNIPLGITHATLNGNEIFRGVKFKPTEAEVAAQAAQDARF